MSKTGSKDAFQIQKTTISEPAENEVIIRVKAIGINFAEILVRKGLYPDAPKILFVPGWEISGVVETAGSNVDAGLVGNRFWH